MLNFSLFRMWKFVQAALKRTKSTAVGCGSAQRPSFRLVALPSSVENMWQYAFVRCSIDEIVLPEKLTYIAPFVFKDCKKLRKVVCNGNLEEICAKAFEGCDSLTELVNVDHVMVSPRHGAPNLQLNL